MNTQRRQMAMAWGTLAVLLTVSCPATGHEIRYGAVRDSAGGVYLWQGKGGGPPHVAPSNNRPTVATVHSENHNNSLNANRWGFIHNDRIGYGLRDGWGRGYGGWGYGGWGYGGWGNGDAWPTYEPAAVDVGQVIPAANYQSQYPPNGNLGAAAAPKVGPSPAVVQILLLDPNAELWLNGVKVQQTGQMRNFITPPLDPGKTYKYEIRAKWTQAGKPFEQTRMLTVEAGQQVGLNIFGRSNEELPLPAIKKQ